MPRNKEKLNFFRRQKQALIIGEEIELLCYTYKGNSSHICGKRFSPLQEGRTIMTITDMLTLLGFAVSMFCLGYTIGKDVNKQK